MAKASNRHLLEIETGIGEPASIPLTAGEELQPTSVGKKGMWRIEAARVLDIHAFFYFDGAALYVQSAEERAPAYVDGQAVATTWTQLHAPCKITVGAATLRFRSMAAGFDEDAVTTAMDRPPIAPPPSPRPVTQRPPTPRPAAGAPPPMAESRPPARPERPFKHGEFASRADEDESTRYAPLDLTSSRPSFNAPASRPGSALGLEPAPPMPHMTHPSGVHLPPMSSPGGAMPPPVMPIPPGMSMSGAFPNPLASSGAYGGTGAYVSPRDDTTSGGQSGGSSLLAKYRELPPIKRILLAIAPFSLIASGYLLLVEDEPPSPRPVAAADAGHEAGAASVAATSGSSAPAASSGPAAAVDSASAEKSRPVAPVCPPGFVPYSVPIDGVIPCVPAGMASPDAAPAQPAAAAAPAASSAEQPAPAARAAAPGGKTLERQAVDALAVNDFARAAELYEELDRTTPNRTYAEAARILRAKADAGAL